MKTRTVTLPSGARMRVPVNIQRLDSERGSLRGWQVRYHGTKYFADSQGTPRDSLKRAIAELEQRILSHPAPYRLRRGPTRSKACGLPVGISGPIVRRRRTFLEANLLVCMPRFEQPPVRATVYLGTENTYTAARYEAGLAKAVKMREAAEKAYRRDATTARRESVR